MSCYPVGETLLPSRTAEASSDLYFTKRSHRCQDQGDITTGGGLWDSVLGYSSLADGAFSSKGTLFFATNRMVRVGGPPFQTATLPGNSDDPHELRNWPGIKTQCVVDRTLIRRGRRSLAFMLRALPFCREVRVATLMIQRFAKRRPAAPNAVPL